MSNPTAVGATANAAPVQADGEKKNAAEPARKKDKGGPELLRKERQGKDGGKGRQVKDGVKKRQGKGGKNDPIGAAGQRQKGPAGNSSGDGPRVKIARAHEGMKYAFRPFQGLSDPREITELNMQT